eukprot:scaffold4805_cov136-Cylindrotheca_fusiformis.AAC.28
MTAMNPSYQAASMNNSGVYHLLNCKHTEATALFQSSLLKTKEQLLLLRSLRREETESSVQLQSSSQGARMVFVDLDCSSHLIKDSAKLSLARKELFVCTSAMIISHDDRDDDPNVCLSSIALCATYNLAIANHVYGIRRRSAPHLRRALKCYQISYMMQKQEPSCYNPTHVLCVLNNMAVIYRCLKDEEKSNKFLQRLFSAMSLMDKTGEKENQPHWEGFWSNVQRLVLRLHQFGAAAA